VTLLPANKRRVHRLTQLYNILLLSCYWLLVSTSLDNYQDNIYTKKFFLNVGAYSTKTSILWDPIMMAHWG